MDIEKAFGKRVEEEPDLAHEVRRIRIELERHCRFVRRVLTWVIVILLAWFLVGMALSWYALPERL